ncbi:hypothetical protein JCM33374_g646 [Metschnikowia sp. JCM 33374]|nr:hypothetical protein JCM33374_g646 [Metschnikowia sp. JCM 33374]
MLFRSAATPGLPSIFADGDTQYLSDEGANTRIKTTKLDIWKDLTKSSPNYESATIIQYMTVRDFNDWLTDIQTDCKFNKRDNLRKRESQAKLYKRNDFLSAGSDTFTCQSTGTPIIKLGINGVPFVKRAKKTLKCNCKSRITALYASGYEHFAGKEINVFEHGDKMVKVTYNWKHEHPVAKLDYFYMSTLSKRMRSALRIVVARGVTYSEIDQARSQYLESRKGNLTLPELLKIKPHHVRYERRLILESFALKSKSLESSLRIWGDEVISQGGKGAPVAFYISNSQSSIVVADFLGKVKDFCHFQPTQAVIDCDAAETKALRHIWGQGLLIVYCRFHILRAFETKLVQKFKPGSDATEMTNQMKDDFTKVIDSRSLTEADERIGYFIERYSSHSQFVNYVKKQWFSKIELIVGGLSAQFDSTSGTNNLAESYHSRLKNDFLTSTNQRPDQHSLAEDGSSNTATVSSGEESDLGANLDRNVIESVSQMNEIDRLQKTPSSDKWKVGTVYMHGDIVVPQTRDIAQKNREDAAKAAEGKRNSKQHLIRRLLRIFKDFVTDFLKDNSVERQSRTIDQVEAFLKGNYGTSEAFSGKQS